MKIIATLADICRPEDWLETHRAHLVGSQIKGEDLLARAANQRGMPGIINIQDAEYLGLPYTKFQGLALMKDSAKEVWLGLAEKIHEAMKEVELDLYEVPEGMNAYYLLEFDICES